MPQCRFEAALDAPLECPLIAVDLGYSATRKSCGLACNLDYSAENYEFGQSIRQTASIIQSVSKETVVLVLEAVLSTRHDEVTGNPISRSERERGREWYRQPGVVTFAAALRFLDQLQRILSPAPRVIVAEAFLSNKSEPTKHADDARNIVRSFWKVDAEPLADGLEPASPHVDGVPSIRVF